MTLRTALDDLCRSMGLVDETGKVQDYRAVPASVAFYAGAASMAEQFAQGSGPMLEVMRGIEKELHLMRKTVLNDKFGSLGQKFEISSPPCNFTNISGQRCCLPLGHVGEHWFS
jgi:hypothetical protein